MATVVITTALAHMLPEHAGVVIYRLMLTRPDYARPWRQDTDPVCRAKWIYDNALRRWQDR